MVWKAWRSWMAWGGLTHMLGSHLYRRMAGVAWWSLLHRGKPRLVHFRSQRWSWYESASPSVPVLFKPWLVSHLLLFCWPKQAHEKVQSQEWKNSLHFLMGGVAKSHYKGVIHTGMGRFIVTIVANNLQYSPVFPIFCLSATC